MANEPPMRAPERKPARRWDYSSHPLKDGGTQIIALAIGVAVTLVLTLLFLAWLMLTQGGAAPAAP
jgi:hypothetical protein